MGTNPRKFSEKIALLNQKEAEANAQFEQVMKEVSDCTKRVGQNHLRISQTPLGSFKGGSLPNVANAAIEIKTDPMCNLTELKKCGRAETPGGTYRERGRSVGVGPMRRPGEKRIDTSPYSSGTYLSPPPDSAWRRTNSDSALHQSTMSTDTRTHHHDNHQSSYDKSQQINNSYPSQHESGCLQIPISNNTGSLPDLTNFYMAPPLPTPLDQEDIATSPLGQQSLPMTRFNYRPPSSPNAQPQSPAQIRRNVYTQDNNMHLPFQDGSIYRHLSPHSMVNSSYLHHAKVVAQEQTTTDGFSTREYRTPQPTRPSPQNSPGLAVPYRSTSPGDVYNSGPSSPVSPATSPANHNFADGNYHFSQEQALQQHFEQRFNMQESPTSPCILTYLPSPNSTTISQGMSPDGQEGGSDADLYSTSPSQLQFGKQQQTTPQTPNTPSSIPDITLTDFSSGANDDMAKHEPNAFDSALFFGQGLELGPIGIDDLQILTDPGMMLEDPSTEEQFRRDRL